MQRVLISLVLALTATRLQSRVSLYRGSLLVCSSAKPSRTHCSHNHRYQSDGWQHRAPIEKGSPPES
jgi:hypothetical protein